MTNLITQLTTKQIIKLKIQEILMSNEGYLNGIELALENIDGMKPEDRLSYAAGVFLLVHSMASSVDGWEKWDDVITLEGITLKQFEKIFPKMKKITKEWLEIDYYITKAKTDQLREEFKQLDEKKENKEKKTDSSMYT